MQTRGQREFSIPGILDESQLHFFSLDHEKWFSEVSISSRNMRVTKWNLVLVSKYENGHMIISISSRQARARKIILNLVSKNCTFSREWEWDSKSKPITVLHRRKSYDMIFDKWSETCMRLDFKFGCLKVVFERQIPNPTSLQRDVCYWHQDSLVSRPRPSASWRILARTEKGYQLSTILKLPFLDSTYHLL